MIKLIYNDDWQYVNADTGVIFTGRVPLDLSVGEEYEERQLDLSKKLYVVKTVHINADGSGQVSSQEVM